MASILNTDLGALYDNWQQRVAFNEGFAREKITSARAAGAEAFSLGVDRVEARNLYFENRAGLVSDAQSAMAGEAVDDLGAVDDIDLVDDLGAVDDVGDESFDPNDYMQVFGKMAYTDNWIDAIEHNSMLDSIAAAEGAESDIDWSNEVFDQDSFSASQGDDYNY